MSEKRDYYEVLGVARDASSDEIRKTYRQAALKNHPDRNPGDADAEARFKEVTEAYQVLSDDEKRARYDRFGHAAFSGGAGFEANGDIFSHFQDIFSEFFGGMGGQQRQRRSGPARGHDIRIEQRISFRDAFTGCKQEVPLRTPVSCEECQGSGAKPGTKRKTCGSCNGSGQISTARGFVMFTQTCPACSGAGSVIQSPCGTCKGQGAVEKSRKVVVNFPAGIDNGQRLRVPGQGMPGSMGGPAGDLYVDVELESDSRYERDGADLITRAHLGIAQAVLGGTIEIELPDDSKVKVEIPGGSQPNDVITLRGQGVPRVDGRGRGALQVVVHVDIPRKVSAKAKELLLSLDEELSKGDSASKKKK